MIHICPSEALLNIWEKIPKKFIIKNEQDKPSCPLCLLAVSQIYNVIKDNKTQVLSAVYYIMSIFDYIIYFM